MSRRMMELDMTFIASDEEMATPSKPSGQPALIVEVCCPECTTEAVTVGLEQDSLEFGQPTYTATVLGRCVSCGHELSPVEAELAKDSARRIARHGG